MRANVDHAATFRRGAAETDRLCHRAL